MHSSLQTLESASFAAWPSEQELDFKGWRLSLDTGYTKRANSANATVAAESLTQADIDAIEARFRQRGLRPTFRLPSFAPVEASDALLAQRGYRRAEPTLVMVRQGLDAERTASESSRLGLGSWPDNAHSWLRSFHSVTGASPSDEAAHLNILQRITHPRAWAVRSAADVPLSCGLGVLVDSRLGLFDIATRADHRGQGLGEALCRELLRWGAQRGARAAFLQVTAANAQALRLYQRLGFQTAYEYWYRILEA